MNSLFKFALALVLGLHACLAQAYNEVKFRKVQSTVTARYEPYQIVRFEASVANLAYNKQVYAHLLGPDGVWIDVPLSYVRPIAGNREVWGTTWLPPFKTTFDLWFALKYVVNGNTYWDNNNRRDYRIAKDSGSLLASDLNVHNAEYRESESMGTERRTVDGRVTLRNLAVHKVVLVRYTTDNWASWRDAPAFYSSDFWRGWYSAASNPNAYGFEEWSFTLDVGATATAVEYAIQYQVAGQTFWDNNHGANYRTTLIRP